MTHSHFFAIDPRARDARFVIPWKTTCKDATARDDRPRLVTLTSVERHFFRLSHNTAISTVLHERLESHQTNQMCLQACIHVASTFCTLTQDYSHLRDPDQSRCGYLHLTCVRLSDRTNLTLFIGKRMSSRHYEIRPSTR